jgi:monovalent cation:H+ antiporter-2, CPA2 family
MHDTALAWVIAVSLACAFVAGFVAHKLRLSPIVGYLIAGIVIGPHSPGFVAETRVAQELSDIGIILLMFGVGLNFSINKLLAVRAVAVPGAILQAAVSATLGALLATSWGWSTAAAIFLGLSMAVSSTVVLVKAHERRQSLGSLEGQTAVGWTIVEDQISVLALVLLPPLAAILTATSTGEQNLRLIGAVAWTLAKVGAFVSLMMFVGKRVCPWLLGVVAKSGSRELFTLFVISFALGIASLSTQIFSVSIALGAFVAGIVMSESELSHRAAAKVLPFQDAFAVLFFVSVGMLFEPSVLFTDPLKVIWVLFIILVVKSTASFAAVLLLRYPLHTALIVGASVAQIGEFSLILAALGLQMGILPPQAYSLILAGSLLSIALNPLAFALIEPVERLLSKFRFLDGIRSLLRCRRCHLSRIMWCL